MPACHKGIEDRRESSPRVVQCCPQGCANEETLYSRRRIVTYDEIKRIYLQFFHGLISIDPKRMLFSLMISNCKRDHQATGFFGVDKGVEGNEI